MSRDSAGEVHELPGPPLRAQPGILRRLFAEPRPVLDELRAAYGGVVGLGAGPVRLAVVGDPRALRELFDLPTAAFRWGHRLNMLRFVVGDASLIVSDGDDHTRRRRAVQGGFSRRRLDAWIPLILQRTDVAIDELLTTVPGGDEPVDLSPFGRRLVLQIVVGTLFGESLAGRADDIGHLFRRPQAYLESPALRQLPHRLPWTRRARVRADRQALDRLIDVEIASARAGRPAEAAGRPDVLGTLAETSDLTDAEIRDQVVSLIGAGFDTTAATLDWMLWCTSLTPGLWDRLRAEAEAAFGPVPSRAGPGAVDPCDARILTRLDLAQRVVQETTRLHPAGVLAPRRAAVEVRVGGYRIPRGTMVLWSAHLAGRDPEAWDDPLRFDPDRFVHRPGDAGRDARSAAAWVPFGAGARSCIGAGLARMQLALIVARLAQRLRFGTDRTVEPRPVGMVVTRPFGGVPLRVRPVGGGAVPPRPGAG